MKNLHNDYKSWNFWNCTMDEKLKIKDEKLRTKHSSSMQPS
jgi:hypothetical protein